LIDSIEEVLNTALARAL